MYNTQTIGRADLVYGYDGPGDGLVARWLGRLKAVIVIAALLMFIAPFAEVNRVMDYGEKSVPAGTPVASYTEVAARMKAMEAEFDGPAKADPGEFYQTLLRAEQLRLVVKAFVFAHQAEETTQMRQWELQSMGYTMPSMLQERYRIRFGAAPALTDMPQSLQDEVNAAEGKLRESGAPIESHFFSLLFFAAVKSILIMTLFFAAAVAKEDGVVRMVLELDQIAYAAVRWPYALFVYPNEDFGDSVKRLKTRLGYLLGALLAAAPVGAIAKAVGGDNGSRTSDAGTPHELILDTIPVPDIGLNIGVMSAKVDANGTVVHKGPVSSWGAQATFTDGWSLGLSGTNAWAGSNGSDEIDFDARKVWNVGIDGRLTADLQLFDIRHLSRIDGGDFIAPALEFDQPVGYGITAYIGAEYDFVPDRPRNAGYVAYVGGRKSWELTNGVSFSASLRAISADGPFGQSQVVTLRDDESLSFTVAEGLAFSLGTKGFTPLQSAQPRGPTRSFNLNLSYALH